MRCDALQFVARSHAALHYVIRLFVASADRGGALHLVTK
jgi:hypothetical protein